MPDMPVRSSDRPAPRAADPIAIFAPARLAFPSYALAIDALAALIASHTPAIVSPAPPAPVEAPAPDLTVTVGQIVHLDGNASPFTVDFGDSASAVNVLSGYNAAHVYDVPGVYSVTIKHDQQPDETRAIAVQADARTVIALDPTADLAQAISHLQDNTVLLLPAGTTFDLHAAAIITASNVTLRGAGNP